ncbi:MAG: hypothetical protein ACM31C_12625 [Acidobacteriota bacterium]
MRAAALILVAACGRSGFDTIDAAGDATPVIDVASDAAVPIQFDASTSTTAVNASTLSWPHAITGADPILFVAVSDRTNAMAGTPPMVASVTYGSAPLQRVTFTQPAGSLDNLELWVLAAPGQGTAPVTVTLMAATAGESAIAISYTGVVQTNPLDRSGATFLSNTTSIDLSWMTNAPHAWAVAAAMDQGGFAMAFSPGTAQTSRQLNVIDAQNFEIQSAADQADVAAPSNVDFHWTSTQASATWCAVGASFIPAGG